VDTGFGLERAAMVLQKVNSVYETDLFKPLMEKIEELATKSYNSHPKAYRIIADHLRAGAFILGDELGVVPSNLDQGYVVRRLIRRAVRFGKMIGIEKNFTAEIGKVVVENYQEVYPELARNKKKIVEELEREETKFKKTLAKGLRELNKVRSKLKIGDKFTGERAFYLYESFGFPLELTQEILAEKGVKVEEADFNQALKKHREVSRKGAEKKFKGGLVDASRETTKLHTATHLLHQALRQVLGKGVAQKGSNITPQRLRFDFSYSEKLTPEQIKKVEKIVNQKINEDLEVKCEEMSVAEAKKQGAIGLFAHKYGDRVKVYAVENFSQEICGGPHVGRTGELGHFKITKEQAVSAGVRRIKAILN
jgi:alanyl-tRNA synthetase